VQPTRGTCANGKEELDTCISFLEFKALPSRQGLHLMDSSERRNQRSRPLHRLSLPTEFPARGIFQLEDTSKQVSDATNTRYVSSSLRPPVDGDKARDRHTLKAISRSGSIIPAPWRFRSRKTPPTLVPSTSTIPGAGYLSAPELVPRREEERCLRNTAITGSEN
jgi:hypothetical protein